MAFEEVTDGSARAVAVLSVQHAAVEVLATTAAASSLGSALLVVPLEPIRVRQVSTVDYFKYKE